MNAAPYILWTGFFVSPAFGSQLDDLLLSAPTQIDFAEVRSHGSLIGCGLQLLKALRDPDFANGIVGMRLGMTFLKMGSKVGWIATFSPVESSTDAPMPRNEPFVPAYGYLVTFTGYSTASRELLASPCPDGGLCVIYPPEPELWGGLIFGSYIKVAYERKAGGVDTISIFDLPGFDDPRLPTMEAKAMKACVATLLS